jgi:hypothetical protein
VLSRSRLHSAGPWAAPLHSTGPWAAPLGLARAKQGQAAREGEGHLRTPPLPPTAGTAQSSRGWAFRLALWRLDPPLLALQASCCPLTTGQNGCLTTRRSLGRRGIFVSFGNASGAVPAFPVLRLINKSAYVTRYV